MNLRLGLRPNLAQFSLLVLVNAFVGAMVGLERSILPLIAEQEFHLAARAAVLSFIVVFGIVKAVTNYFAGRFSDALGRKVVLVSGWLVAVPVPFLLMWAPSWTWILFANVLLGVSQGLAWSTTVIMKIDLAGPERRGLAMGLNEFAGYLAVGVVAAVTSSIAARYGLRPQPFYLGIGFVLAGLLLSAFVVRETHGHAKHEAQSSGADPRAAAVSQKEVFLRTSFRDRDLSAVSQAGLVNNLNDGMAWGLFPLFFAAAGMSLQQIGWLAALYPAVWGAGQLFTGALSDRFGRKWMIAGGMWMQAAGIAVLVLSHRFAGFAAGGALLGAGTAMVYPVLLAAIGDVAHPAWRASAVGVYRFWRDLGYAAGALLAGVTADALGLQAAIWIVAAITGLSGIVVAVRMRETRHAAAAVLGVSVALMLRVMPAGAQDAQLGIYADPQATKACVTAPEGEHTTLYVVATLPDGRVPAISGAEFRIEVSRPAGYRISFTAEPWLSALGKSARPDATGSRRSGRHDTSLPVRRDPERPAARVGHARCVHPLGAQLRVVREAANPLLRSESCLCVRGAMRQCREQHLYRHEYPLLPGSCAGRAAGRRGGLRRRSQSRARGPRSAVRDRPFARARQQRGDFIHSTGGRSTY